MTDAPEAPRQEREALADFIYENGPLDACASRIGAGLLAERILAAGYVTPEAHAAALREAWEARERLMKWFTHSGASITSRWDRIPPEERVAIVEGFRALTPPAPKGDARE
jgi:FAD/FMN-containing dehydrogenase